MPDINKHEVEIIDLKNQNIQDFEKDKIQAKQIENLQNEISNLKKREQINIKKIENDYKKLRKIILDENVSITLNNKIDNNKTEVTNKINEVNEELNNKFSTNKVEVNNKINTINEQLDTKATVVSLEKFIENDTDHTQAFKNALSFCKSNNKSLYIPDGNYYLNESLVIDQDGLEIIGNSRNTKLLIGHNSYAFEINSHRTRIKNIRFEPRNKNYNFLYSGLHMKGSQGLIKNVYIYNCNNGIKFSTECWCSNAKEINIYNSKKGIIFGEGSGGVFLEFELINGTLSYDNPILDESIGIVFEENTGHHIISSGGQLSCFSYCFDIKNGDNFRPSKIGKIYVEHNINEFTPDSTGTISMLETHVAQDYNSNNNQIIKLTNNGINKATQFNNAKDSAIPINNLLAYFDFNRNSPFTDKSNNNAIFSGDENYTIENDKNLFGKSINIKASSNGKSGNIEIPNLSSKFSIVVSYRQVTDVVNQNNVRLFELTNKDTSTNSCDLMFVPDSANNLTIFDRTVTPNTSTLINLGKSYKNGYNNCVCFTFDLDTGNICGYTPNNYSIKVNKEVTKTLKNNFTLNVMKSWTTLTQAEILNYFAVFDDILSYEEFINIYKEVKPLL